jgi:hypothetical protein
VQLLTFVLSVLPVVQIFLQQKEPDWLLLVPMSGQYTLLKQALRGEAIPLGELALSYLVPAVLIVAALMALSRLLARESVLAGK